MEARHLDRRGAVVGNDVVRRRRRAQVRDGVRGRGLSGKRRGRRGNGEVGVDVCADAIGDTQGGQRAIGVIVELRYVKVSSALEEQQGVRTMRTVSTRSWAAAVARPSRAGSMSAESSAGPYILDVAQLTEVIIS